MKNAENLGQFGINLEHQMLHRRIGTSGGNYPVNQSQGIALPVDILTRNTTQLGSRVSGRTKSAIGFAKNAQ